jgi:hypothetical protein
MTEQKIITIGNHLIPYISNTVIVLIIAGTAVFGGLKLYNKMERIDKNNELVLANYTESNRKNVLLKVIDSNMNIPVEQKVKLRDTIYDLCYLRNIQLSMICGLIEVESQWTTTISSSCNAKGLMQILPQYARPYLRNERIEYNPSILYDPIVNSIIGISILADLHAGHMEAGMEKNDDWTMTLHSYFWGKENTDELYGKKDKRVGVPNLAYPMRVMEAAKKYKNLGL